MVECRPAGRGGERKEGSTVCAPSAALSLNRVGHPHTSLLVVLARPQMWHLPLRTAVINWSFSLLPSRGEEAAAGGISSYFLPVPHSLITPTTSLCSAGLVQQPPYPPRMLFLECPPRPTHHTSCFPEVSFPKAHPGWTPAPRKELPMAKAARK